MKKTTLFLLVLLCPLMFYFSAYAKTGGGESLDQIVAVVNDDVVTQSELNRAVEIAKIQIANENISMPPLSVLQKQILDQLINKKIQLQLAKQAGVEASDADLDRIVHSVAQQNQMSVAAFYQRLNHEGMSTEDYRKEMREQLTVQKLQQQEVVSRINITSDEVTNFLKSKAWQTSGSREYHLEDILIPLSDTPSTEEIEKARTRAQAVVAKINAGQSFKSAAQSESGSADALKGGDLGWRQLPEIPNAFAEKVVRMQANEIAEPIQTPNGYHIIHLLAVRSTKSDQPAPDRKQIERFLLERKFEEAVQNWVSRIRGQAFIVINPPVAKA